MSELTFFVPGPLAGLNEIIDAAKSGHGKGNAYARLKKAETEKVAWCARAARLPTLTGARFRFLWWEAKRNRDKDNVAAGRKFILDGLVEAGVLPNDGWQEVQDWEDAFGFGPGGKPGVYVTIWPR